MQRNSWLKSLYRRLTRQTSRTDARRKLRLTRQVSATAEVLELRQMLSNHAPVGTSGIVTTLENTAYTLKTTDFGFTDPNDSPPNSLQAVKFTIVPTAGTLADNGSAVTTNQLVSATDISGGLLVFTPKSDLSGGPYFLGQFKVQDDGGTAGGGVNLDPNPKVLNIAITHVNQAPAGTNATITYGENLSYAFKVADFGLTDPHDSPANSLSAVTISTLPLSGSLTNNGATFTAGTSISVTDIKAGKLKFTPATNEVGSPYTSFTFQVQDNGGTANGGHDLDPNPETLTMNITPVNQAPIGTSGTVTTLKNTAYTLQTTDFGFTDPNDSPSNSLLAVKFTIVPTAGTLTNNGTSVTAGQLVSVTDISGGLLVFTPKTDLSGGPFFLAQFKVEDNGGTAYGGIDLDPNPKVLYVALPHLNHAPVGADATITMAENTSYALKAADFGMTDPNDTPGDRLSAVTITTLPVLGTLTNHGVAFDAGTSISAADIRAGNLRFTPESNGLGSQYTSFTFQVQDNGGTFSGGTDLDPTPKTLTFDVVRYNHTPRGTDGTVTAMKDTPYVLKVADFGFTDPQDSPPNSLKAVWFTNLPTLGTLTDNGVPLTRNQFVSATDINAGRLVFTPITHLSSGKYSTPYFLAQFVVQDDGGTALGALDYNHDPAYFQNTLKIVITPNAAPIGTSETRITSETGRCDFHTADFGFSDPNDFPANAFIGVVITTVPTKGTLSFIRHPQPITAGEFISSGAFFYGIDYQAAAGATGVDSFTFQVRDNGGTANGSLDTDPNPKTITITIK